MIYEEFYIDGLEVDIKDVNIQTVRNTPYFGDLSKITQNTTLTITLPTTERNKAVMEYLNEHDAATDFPYKNHLANYIVDGVQMIRNGVISVLGDFEIQVVYGIDKTLYSTLNEKKLNEMEYTGLFVESSWLVDWNKGDGSTTKMFAPYKKYQYLNYIKGKRTSEVEIGGGIIYVKADVDPFFASDVDEMSQHPFVLASYILDAIGIVSGLPTDIFSKLKSRLTDIGLILPGNKDNYSKTITYTHSGNSFNSNKLFLGYGTFNGMFIKGNYDVLPQTGLMPFMEATIEFNLNLSITGSNNLQYVNSLLLVGSWFDPEIGAVKYDVLETIPHTSINSQYLTFTNVKVIYKVDATSFKYTAGISIMFGRATNKPLIYLLSYGSTISTTFKSEKSVYCFPDYLGNTFGRYNTVANLPEISALDFIKAICAYTGAFIGEDFDTYYLEQFKTNLTTGNVLNWSGRISNVVESEYKFNGSAQKNYIKFSNDENVADTKYILEVDDETLENEKDMFVLPFDSPYGGINKLSEFILYEQDVKGDETVDINTKSKVYFTLKLKPPYNEGDLWATVENRVTVYLLCTNSKEVNEDFERTDFITYPYRYTNGRFPSTPYVVGELAGVKGRAYICTFGRSSGTTQEGDFELYTEVNAKAVINSTILPPYNKGDIWIYSDNSGKTINRIANTSKSATEDYSDDDWDYTNNKQVFTQEEPTVPYFKGDTWYDSEKVYVANKDQFDAFDVDDWDLKIDSFKDYVDDFAKDSVYSPQEKKIHRVEWENRLKEKWELNTQATSFGITTEYTNFNSAFVALSTYLNGGTAWTTGIPLWLGTELTISQVITPSTFRAKWNDMYSTLAIVKNKIAQVAKEYDPFFIGGYNFIKNSNLAKGLVDGWTLENANNNEIVYNNGSNLPDGATHGYKFKPISGYGGIWYLRTALKIVAGKTYTLSFYVKADANCTMQYGDEGITRASISVTSTWQRVVQTFTASVSSNISFYSNSGSEYTYVTNFQLEAGSNVSDWNNNTDTKLSAFDYLAEAMTDEADFETVGGLALAKVILVRGSDTVIRGGFSGLETDDLLLWGGTYQDALDGVANVVIKKGGEFFLGGEQNRRKVEVTMQNLDTLENYIDRDMVGVTMYSISPKSNTILFKDVTINNYQVISELKLNGTSDSKEIVLSSDGILSLNLSTVQEIYENTEIQTINYLSSVWIRKIFDANGEPVSVYLYETSDQGSIEYDSQTPSNTIYGAKLVGSYYLEKGTYVIEAISKVIIPTYLIPTPPTNMNGAITASILWDSIGYTLSSSKTVLAANGFACVRDEYNYFYLSQAIGTQFLNGRGNMQWLSEDGTKGLRVTNEGVQKYNGSTWVTL